MAERWPHTGAVLSGGPSRRMGAQKQSLAMPGGGTIIEAVADAIGVVCAETVFVGGPSRGRMVIDDLRPGTSPLIGIEALLASGIDSDYLVCPNDIPLVTPDLLLMLVGPSNSTASIFAIEGETRMRSLPLRIRESALAEVSRALDEGEHAIHRVLRKLDVETIELDSTRATGLFNVNAPDDYAAVIELSKRDPLSRS